MGEKTVVSCPGKVLVAGGYLVLDQRFNGYVVATASRFYTVVSSPSTALETSELAIIARSPQFDDAEWSFTCMETAEGRNCHVELADGKPRNPFLQIAIEEALRIVMAVKGNLPTGSVDIAVLGDNDFYSQDRSTAIAEPIPFVKLHTTLSKVHKTGLGSSAAMVTSLVGGLLSHYGIDIVAEQALLHNLAQYAHSLAQGKIGSGFDVSAAVYGSQVYRRFSPASLPDLATSPDLSTAELLRSLRPDSNPSWTDSETSGSVQPFGLPPLTSLLLADVDIGSNTPSMVSKVLAWRKAGSTAAEELWETIASGNVALARCFEACNAAYERDSKGYEEEVQSLASTKGDQWHAISGDNRSSVLLDVRTAIGTFRNNMRTLGVASSVPIEPPEQTRLLDDIAANCVGVLGGGVPGAGGYDAIWILVLAPALEPLDDIERYLSSYSHASVRPLSKAARVLGRRSETTSSSRRGVQIERVEDVPGLAEALQ